MANIGEQNKNQSLPSTQTNVIEELKKSINILSDHLENENSPWLNNIISAINTLIGLFLALDDEKSLLSESSIQNASLLLLSGHNFFSARQNIKEIKSFLNLNEDYQLLKTELEGIIGTVETKNAEIEKIVKKIKDELITKIMEEYHSNKDDSQITNYIEDLNFHTLCLNHEIQFCLNQVNTAIERIGKFIQEIEEAGQRDTPKSVLDRFYPQIAPLVALAKAPTLIFTAGIIGAGFLFCYDFVRQRKQGVEREKMEEELKKQQRKLEEFKNQLEENKIRVDGYVEYLKNILKDYAQLIQVIDSSD